MIHQKWRITPHSFKIDKKGIGEAVYSIQTPTVKYTAVFFTNELADELRCDRVIAESWDIAFCLCSGTITTADIKELAKNLPLQEKGRYSTDVFCISRANKSMRLFENYSSCYVDSEHLDTKAFSKICIL